MKRHILPEESVIRLDLAIELMRVASDNSTRDYLCKGIYEHVLNMTSDGEFSVAKTAVMIGHAYKNVMDIQTVIVSPYPGGVCKPIVKFVDEELREISDEEDLPNFKCA